MARTCCMGCCLFLMSIILPPLAVLMDAGCGIHFCLNLLLTSLAFIPGIIHALWVCFFRETDDYQIHQNHIIITHTDIHDDRRSIVH